MNRSLLSFLALAALCLPSVRAAEPIPATNKVGGFAIGCQAWSFKEYTAMEAVEKTAAVGGKVIEFYSKQKFSPDNLAQWGHNSPPEMVAQMKEQLKKFGVLAVAYGVVEIPKDPAEARKIFEFGKTMGLRVINTESVDSIDTFEPLVKEFDIKVGFHDHPKKAEKPNYKMWDPNYILSVIKDRDPRIGACADTGHWQRSGLAPVDCLRILKGRIVSSHLKDLNVLGDLKAHDVPYGTGVGDVKAILDEFKAQGFDGPISIEYEYDWTTNMPEIKQCLDFVRAYGGGK